MLNITELLEIKSMCYSRIDDFNEYRKDFNGIDDIKYFDSQTALYNKIIKKVDKLIKLRKK